LPKNNFVSCFQTSQLILTEGAVGQRIEHEFALEPDRDILYAALLYSAEGRAALETIYRQYLQIAQDHRLPILLMTNTRRANQERVLRSAYQDKDIMRDYAGFLRGLAREYRCSAFVGGMMGCKGDAYSGDQGLSAEEAQRFHAWQASAFHNAPIDFLFAGIMPAKDEAVGMAKTMEQSGLPYIISLMVNRNGTILDGHSIHDVIQAIDGAVAQKPLCYMTNCVHPAILREALGKPFNNTELVKERFCGIQANAACVDPRELDHSAELKTTEAKALAHQFEQLHNDFPMKIMGGCCGTDHTHIEEIARRFGKAV